MTIGYMKKTNIRSLMSNNGLMHIRGDYYYLKTDNSTYREDYNIFVITKESSEGAPTYNFVDPIELRTLIMELSPDLKETVSFADTARQLKLPWPLVAKAKKLDDSMDGFCLSIV